MIINLMIRLKTRIDNTFNRMSIQLFVQQIEDFVDVVFGAEEDRRPFVNAFGFDVENRFFAIRGHSARVLHYERHWVALIE